MGNKVKRLPNGWRDKVLAVKRMCQGVVEEYNKHTMTLEAALKRLELSGAFQFQAYGVYANGEAGPYIRIGEVAFNQRPEYAYIQITFDVGDVAVVMNWHFRKQRLRLSEYCDVFTKPGFEGVVEGYKW